MNFSLSSKAIATTKADCLVVGVPEKGDWPESTTHADEALDGLIKKLQTAGDITGKNGSTALFPLDGRAWSRLLVVGTGKTMTVHLPTFARPLPPFSAPSRTALRKAH